MPANGRRDLSRRLKINIKKAAVPLQACSDTEGSRKLRFPYFMTTARVDGKVVSPTHRPHLPPGNSSGTHFCQRLSRPQGHSAIGRIMSMTPSGIEPATFRFVAQNLNHCATAVPELLRGRCTMSNTTFLAQEWTYFAVGEVRNDDLTFKRRIKSHLLFAGIIRSSPYSPRFQDNG